MVRSVPGELSTDSNAVLALAQADGHVTQLCIAKVGVQLAACVYNTVSDVLQALQGGPMIIKVAHAQICTI